MSKRYVTLSVAVVFLFSCIFGRVGYLIFSKAYTVSDSYNSYSLFVDRRDVQLYYRDGSKLNNNIKNTVSVIRPVTSDIAAVHRNFTASEEKRITQELRSGYPVIVDGAFDDLKNIETFDTETTAEQLVSTSSSGLLKYAQSEQAELKINFLVDAKGRLLTGDEGTVERGDYYKRGGYVLTLDKDVQEIAYNAAASIKSGVVIVMDVKTARILACVTKPDDTYINKAVQQYSAGSVFKTVVTACAIENDIDYHYVCGGTCRVGDTEFSCQKNKVHGYETLKTALANSCNCYFVNLAQYLGSEKLLDTAKKLGFGKNIELFKGWNIKSSVLPSENDLLSKGELALFGFGQGKLTVTPLQMCSALCTISNSGNYVSPSLVLSEKADNGSITEYKNESEKRVLRESTCEKLLKYLRYVVTDGTGYNAEDSSYKAAGKTATAQTGQYLNGEEIYNTWFAGVYPYDDTEYAIVIMCENGKSGAEDCCPVFRTIVENLPSK